MCLLVQRQLPPAQFELPVRRSFVGPHVIGIAVFAAAFGLLAPLSLAQEVSNGTYVLESSTMTMMAFTASSDAYTVTATMGQPVAGGLLSNAFFTVDVGYLNNLDADGDGVSGSFDLCPTQYAGCNDTNHDGCIDVPDPDGDGDGVGRGACDCDDANGQIWGRPGEVRNLRFASATSIAWDPPTAPGGTQPRYDVIRSSDVSDFVTSALCVEWDDASDTSAHDPGIPAAGAIFYYLIRAENTCALGSGSLGISRGSYLRTARSCG